MNASDYDTDTPNIALVSWVWITQLDLSTPQSSALSEPVAKPTFDWLKPVRQWLDRIEVNDAGFARFICNLIPSQCPFERDVTLFGYTLVHIPPLCKLNPVYDQVVALRFRALCYLADVCGEDVTPYC
jgi:hypothetical protein